MRKGLWFFQNIFSIMYEDLRLFFVFSYLLLFFLALLVFPSSYPLIDVIL